MTERRRSQRLKIGNDVVINGSVFAEGLDLNEDGMYIYVGRSFAPESIIDLGFNLGGETVNVPAKVLHTQPGIGFGVNFFEFPDEVRDRIRAYVNGKAREAEEA
jgi:hypothetical protein